MAEAAIRRLRGRWSSTRSARITWPSNWLYERPAGSSIFSHAGVELWAVLMLEGPEQGMPVIQRFFDWMASTSRVIA